MRRYTKKPGLAVCMIPGAGRVRDGQILEGDEFARYCPSVLVEVEEPDRRFVQAEDGSALRTTREDTTVKVPVPEPEPEEENEPEPEEDAPSMEWRKTALVAYAVAQGIEVDGMTKAEILAALEGGD